MIEPDRRSFLKAAVAGAAGVSLSLRALARSEPEPIVAVPLSDNIVQITGAGGNVVAVTGADGVLLVDSGVEERSKDLLKAVGKLPGGQHIHTLINTHWHWDHTGGNERLGKDKVKIIAHENTKLWLGADFYCDWQDNRHYTPRPKVALPTETFYTSGQMTANGQDIVYGYLPRAHTDSDIYVFFPKANVLVAGGLVSVGAYPVLDYTTGGWIGGIDDASKALVGIANKDTRIVPGVGPVQTYADLQAQSEMLHTMHERLVDLMRKGIGTDDLAAHPPTEEFNAKWGDPQLFLANAYRGMWGHVRELGKIV
ncbi:MAG: fold metallo-hydrolase [Gammaproteobacteria bacterium]|nr:fold metallo-hydrolase [Gammaproteobacteria bacterium]